MNIEQRLDAVADKAIAENKIVGTVLIVRKDGDVVYERAHGLADREAGRPMTVDTIFRLSSLTKPIVAATVLALVDAGKLRLDAPVATYLPDFRPRLTDGSQPDITIDHLLTHTSGLSVASILTAEEQATRVNRWHLGADAIVARIAALPLQFAPGGGWSYGPSIDVLGVIASRVSGGTLDDTIRQFITGPLRMDDSRFGVTDAARLAAPYADGAAGPVLMGDPHSVPNPFGGMTTFDPGRIFDARAFQSGGGGMAGTGPDFMRLLEALRTGGGAVLKPETVLLGLGNRTPLLAQSQGPGWLFSYFGAWLDDAQVAGSPAAIGTNRWGGIYGHNWFLDAENGLSVVSMSNTGLEGCDGAYKEAVRDAVYAGL
ncbi:serine hydrolase domain-containing protein [Devosia sp. SL43]|uniref:serine hydrolase domain-containing protein n=1 Tax=Devosia sp. SL43 TaxID=2806348 RepID=UPI001F25EB06|nr:serine hydrolase domain-containing protein [Devosia sp. SL43]UJW85956.1 beta-lactamase family protein [Devosia sp. SL43]